MMRLRSAKKMMMASEGSNPTMKPPTKPEKGKEAITESGSVAKLITNAIPRTGIVQNRKSRTKRMIEIAFLNLSALGDVPNHAHCTSIGSGD